MDGRTNTRGTVLAALVAALVALGAVGALGTPVAAGAAATLGFDIPETVAVGESAGGAVTFAGVGDADGVGSYTVNVTYDPDAVSVSASGTSTFDVETATPEPGVLRVTGYTAQHPGPDGSGELFDLAVSGESGTDSTTLGLEVETFTDADGDPLAGTTGSATVAVEAGSGGDDGDDGGGGGGGAPVGGGATGDVEIAERALLNDSVAAGSAVVARVDLVNYDPGRGTIPLELTADGDVVSRRTVAVGASTERSVFLRNEFDRPGTYAVGVNGVQIGSVTVTDTGAGTATPTVGAGTPTPRDTTTTPGTTEPTTTAPATATSPGATTSSDGPGFGAVAALLSVVLAALVGTRRRR